MLGARQFWILISCNWRTFNGRDFFVFNSSRVTRICSLVNSTVFNLCLTEGKFLLLEARAAYNTYIPVMSFVIFSMFFEYDVILSDFQQ